MEKPMIYSSNMEFEHELWKTEIFFWKEELISFNKKFSELTVRWARPGNRSKIGFYQKKFIVHGEVIEDLLEILEKQEKQILKQYGSLKFERDPEIPKIHRQVKKMMEDEREIYANLKAEVSSFLAK